MILLKNEVISMYQVAVLKDDNFLKEINKHKYLIVLFSSPDCGSCQLAKKHVIDTAEQFKDIEVRECYIDAAPETIKKYKINSSPLIKIFVDGESVYTGFGVRTPTDLYYQFKGFFPSINYYEDLLDD